LCAQIRPFGYSVDTSTRVVSDDAVPVDVVAGSCAARNRIVGGGFAGGVVCIVCIIGVRERCAVVRLRVGSADRLLRTFFRCFFLCPRKRRVQCIVVCNAEFCLHSRRCRGTGELCNFSASSVCRARRGRRCRGRASARRTRWTGSKCGRRRVRRARRWEIAP
jgi:hypothetical protein